MHMMERHDARGILLVDRQIYEQARGELWQLRGSLYQLIFGVINTWFNRKKAATLAGLAFGQTVLSRSVQAAGLDWDESEAHSAIYDTEKTAALFCAIVNRWKILTGL